MIKKTVWLENLVLLNAMVQKSGGIMEIKSSYTDWEGDVQCEVFLSRPLTTDCEIHYDVNRCRKQ